MELVSVDNNSAILREKCEYIEIVNDEIREILDAMVDFCEKGTRPKTLSLAANQVGINKRLIVIYDNDEVLKLVNPEIITEKGKQIFLEGCVNVDTKKERPGGFVERPAYIKVKALNYHGEVVEITAEGVLAIMLCHEIDHLDGIMFTDKLVSELYIFNTPEERTEFRIQNPLKVIEEPHEVDKSNINKLIKKS